MFQIFFDGEQIGQAQVIKEGLYYKITCICTFSDDKVHRIVVSDGESIVNLGVCIPNGDKYYISTKIPVKYLRGDSLNFSIESNLTSAISVYSRKPFAYLDKLETAHLQMTNGQPRIIIDQFQDPQGSGQNPEYLNK